MSLLGIRAAVISPESLVHAGLENGGNILSSLLLLLAGNLF